jgi:hypothetical protein
MKRLILISLVGIGLIIVLPYAFVLADSSSYDDYNNTLPPYSSSAPNDYVNNRNATVQDVTIPEPSSDVLVTISHVEVLEWTPDGKQAKVHEQGYKEGVDENGNDYHSEFETTTQYVYDANIGLINKTISDSWSDDAPNNNVHTEVTVMNRAVNGVVVEQYIETTVDGPEGTKVMHERRYNMVDNDGDGVPDEWDREYWEEDGQTSSQQNGQASAQGSSSTEEENGTVSVQGYTSDTPDESTYQEGDKGEDTKGAYSTDSKKKSGKKSSKKSGKKSDGKSGGESGGEGGK